MFAPSSDTSGADFEAHPEVNLEGTFPPPNPLEVSMDVSFHETAEEISGINLSLASDISLEISHCSFVDETQDIDESRLNDRNVVQAQSPVRRLMQHVARVHVVPPSPLRASQAVRPPPSATAPPQDEEEQPDLEDGMPPNAPANTHKQQMLRIFKEVAEQIVVFSSLLSIPYTKGPDVPDLAHLTGSALWATIYGCPSPKVAFHAVAALTRLASPQAMLGLELPRAEVDPEKSTARLLLSCDRLTARNDSWGFESARGAVAAHGKHVWYYEVVIMSKGIIQIGWARDVCKFEPENGLGVGDNVDSCAYDGHRCRAWHGTGEAAKDNNYGEAWSVGDVVGCIFNAATGVASFTLNGRDLGPAFAGLMDEPDAIWYPAVSLSSGQQLNFNFGRNGFWCPPPRGAIAFEEDNTVQTHASQFNRAVPRGRTTAAPQSPSPSLSAWPSASLSQDVTYTIKSSSPVPIIYYEAAGLGAGAAIGYHNAAAEQADSSGGVLSGGQKYAATIDGMSRLNIGGSPVGPLITETTTVGCGVSFEKVGAVALPFAFFTVDGTVLQTGLRLGQGRHRIFPWMSAPRPRPNFCQQRFNYPVADDRKQRANLAKQLATWANAAQIPNSA
jgi:hypothetical protein